MDIVIKSTYNIDKHLFSKHCFQSCFDKLGSNLQIQTCKVFLKEYPDKNLNFRVDIYLSLYKSQNAHFHSSAKSTNQAFDLCLRKALRFLNNKFETKNKKLHKLK